MTLNYLKRLSRHSATLTVRTAHAVSILTTTGRHLCDDDRLTIIGALSTVIDELLNADDVSDEAA